MVTSPPQHSFLEMINGSPGSNLNQMRCNYLLNVTQLQKTKVYATLKVAGDRAMTVTLCVGIKRLLSAQRASHF